MRKFVVPSALLVLCLLLIVFSNACLTAASDALEAWWNRVLPALFPFSVFLSLSNQTGSFQLLERICRPIAKKLRIHVALPSCMLFGMLSGYPNGARLCAMRDIPFEAAYCSFCSPVFLLGVVAQGLYGYERIAFPLMIAHIGSGLITVLPRSVSAHTKPFASHSSHSNTATQGFFPQLRESLSIMASVGGCMVLFSVGTALFGQLRLLYPLAMLLRPFSLTEADLLAMLHGIFEFAGGCVSIAALDLPLRMRVAMTACTVSFGGLCVLMQSAMFLNNAALRRYACIKVQQGIIAAILAYVLYPIFCTRDAAVMASSDQIFGYATNALSMGSILLSSCIVLFSFYLFALALSRWSAQKQKHRT